jgi:DNA repair photolyase
MPARPLAVSSIQAAHTRLTGPTPARGSPVNPANRFERLAIDFEDGSMADGVAERPALRTQFFKDHASSILTRNASPDLGFGASINVYRGCEHGCAYCYARPYHEYLGFSAGLDFESRIMVKENAPELLAAELAKPSWRPEVLAMSGVTDCYQPVERKLELTRRCLAVLADFRQPVAIITKNQLVTRDIDLLRQLAAHDAVRVTLSITSLDETLAHALEPRASPPKQRLEAIRHLREAGIVAGVNLAPVIPGLNDHEIPRILEAAAAAGAVYANWIMLRLPHGVKDIFLAWLDRHFPDRKARVISRIRDTRGGALNDSTFGQRFTGQGIFAEQIDALFRAAAHRLGLDRPVPAMLGASFRRPGPQQLELEGLGAKG